MKTRFAISLFILLFSWFAGFTQTAKEPVYHIVQPKEGLYGIAQRNGTTVEQLKIWNRLSDNNISIGQQLIVGYKTSSNTNQKPTQQENSDTDGKYIYHTVQPQENLYRISLKYKTTAEDLKRWNKLPNNDISVGQRLIVGMEEAEEEEIAPVKNEQDERDAAYSEKLKDADNAFDAGYYSGAKKLYEEALALKPYEKYPREKISEIETILEQQEAEREALKEKEQAGKTAQQYEQAVKTGDSFFQSGNLAEAKKQYEQALILKPDETYPKEKITEINRLLADEDQYKAFIKRGDEAYNSEDYSTAKNFFTQALQIKSGDAYAQSMLDAIARADEQKSVKTKEAKAKPDKTPAIADNTVKTWWVEAAYVLVPNSISNGGELHLDFPLRKRNSDKRIFPTIGVGGGYIQKVEHDYEFPEFTTDVKIRRYYGAGVFGVRFLARGIGFAPRVGYNFTRQQYDYYNITNCEDCTDKVESNLHRLSGEMYIHIPFSRKHSNYGFIAGCKYLYHPKKSDSNLLLIKAGFTF